jgi:microcin C transport system permease protein
MMNKKKKLFISPIILKRLKKFRSIKRGFYSLIILGIIFIISFFTEFFINSSPLLVKFNNKLYFTAYKNVSLKKDIYYLSAASKEKYNEFKNKYEKKEDGISIEMLNKYKEEYEFYEIIKTAFSSSRFLNIAFRQQNTGNFAILPIYPYGPNENLLDELEGQNPPTKPELIHLLGTDDRGRDVLARLVYGFRISMTFAIILTIIEYIIGISIGACMGFYGGKADFFGMRFIEIWSSIPFLYMVMIISAILIPNFFLLILIISLFSWIGMAWYIRAEFFKEKSKDYVLAAYAIGVKDIKIIFSHIFPNSLTPVVSFLPFSVIGGISSLVSLDFLGFGLPEPTPSWGEMLGQGVANLSSWWLTASPVAAIFITLMLITFIGEAIREAFDPKIYSRLR